MSWYSEGRCWLKWYPGLLKREGVLPYLSSSLFLVIWLACGGICTWGHSAGEESPHLIELGLVASNDQLRELWASTSAGTPTPLATEAEALWPISVSSA